MVQTRCTADALVSDSGAEPAPTCINGGKMPSTNTPGSRRTIQTGPPGGHARSAGTRWRLRCYNAHQASVHIIVTLYK